MDHSQSHPADERFGEEFVEVEVPKAPSRSVVAFSCIALATVAAVIGAVSYYAHASYEKALANETKLKADRAVNELTPGTQEAWTAYVDRRVAAAIEVKAGAISVTDISNENRLLSRNTPYQVRCSPMESSIEFGYGENSVSVPIYGWLVDRNAESPPALGVTESSVAAANLSRTLCERISLSLSKIVQP